MICVRFDDLYWTRGIPIEERRRREALLWAEHHREEDEASWEPAIYDVLCGSVGTVANEGVVARMSARILQDEEGKTVMDEYMTKAVTVFATARAGDLYVADHRWQMILKTAAWFASFDRKTLARAGSEERAWAATYERRADLAADGRRQITAGQNLALFGAVLQARMTIVLQVKLRPSTKITASIEQKLLTQNAQTLEINDLRREVISWRVL